MIAKFASKRRGSSSAIFPTALICSLLAGCGATTESTDGRGTIEVPSNTVVFTVGLGYDTPSDKTPEKTGDVVIELSPKIAPQHAKRIKALTRKGYYDGKIFHRVVEGFMAQTGSPTGNGVGGAPGYPDLKAEFSKTPFKRGVVGMARTQSPNSANAQFFIMYARDFGLDGKYTVVGEVVSGMDTVDRLRRTAQFTADGEQPMLDVVPDRIIRAKIGAPTKAP